MTQGALPARDTEPLNRPASPLVSDIPLPFPDLCAKIHARVTAFLEEPDVSDRAKGVQQQTRISLDIIKKALDQYRYCHRRVCAPGC